MSSLRLPAALRPRPSAAFLVLCALASGAAAQRGPSPVRVDEVVLRPVQEKRHVTGEVRARQRSLVASREPGLVAEVLVREGGRVEKGQPLARLDARLLEAERAILEGQEALAGAVRDERASSLEQARRDLAVLEELAGRDAVNPKELADARTAAEVAKARLAQSNQDLVVLGARLALLDQRISDMAPEAPFAGVVVARRAEAGQWIAAGDAVIELVSTEALEGWLDVPQAYFAAVSGSSEPMRIVVDAGGELEVEGWRIVPSVRSAGRTFPLVVDLPAEAGLAAGMSLTADVPTGKEQERLTVDRDGILRGEAGFHVFVAQPGSEGSYAAALVPVEVLFYVGDRAAVRSPRLAPGDLVVVEGNERLYPTAPVAPREGTR